MEEAEKENEKEKENDILLQDYLNWKKHFINITSVLGVKFNKNDTSKFVKILKPYKNPYKNLNPIKHSKDSNDNIYLTKFTFEEKNALIDILKPESKYSIVEEQLTLNEKNYTYEEIFKFFIEEEIKNKKLIEDESSLNDLLKSLPNGFEIVGKNVDVTAAMKDKIETKFSNLDKYLIIDPDTIARVVARVYPNAQKVEVTIPSKVGVLRAEVVHDDFYAAVDLAIDKLEDQLEEKFGCSAIVRAK